MPEPTVTTRAPSTVATSPLTRCDHPTNQRLKVRRLMTLIVPTVLHNSGTLPASAVSGDGSGPEAAG